ncbi:hypothetical protein [Benzoatithermus flavus]|uniref:Lipoprotein n=1 Tax=Benzoatithermus flavus TaxID=3108223 RepID=A0ABU8XYF2_9PROT
MAQGKRVAAILLLLGLAGCASRSPVELGRDADPRAARARLAEAARQGPVRLEVNGLPRTTDGSLAVTDVLKQAARGITGLEVRFAPPTEAVGTARLVLLFDPPQVAGAARVCSASTLPEPRPGAEPLRLRAVFCDGGAYLADATGTTTDRSKAGVERLIWRTTGRLFPDDYQESYGFHLLGNRIGFSGRLGL